MAYGRLNKEKTDNTAAQAYGRLRGRGATDTNTRVFNSLPGEVIRVVGTYKGKSECVGGAREVVTDLPTSLFNYKQKLDIINSNEPLPGSVAIMPAGLPGHVGVVLTSDDDFVYMYDVNADGKNTQMIRKVPKDKIDGYYKGDPEKVRQDYITKALTYLDTPVAPEEEKLIAQAEQETVKFNTEKVIEEIVKENPDYAEELGGLKKAIDEAVGQPGFMETFKNNMLAGFSEGGAMKTFLDPTIGALKSLNRHIENGSVLVQKGMNVVSSWIADKLGFDEAAKEMRETEPGRINPMLEEAMGLSQGTLTTSANGWQTAGALLETMGEFYATGKAAGVFEKAIGGSSLLAKFPGISKGIAQLATIMGIEGVTAGATAATQEGEVMTEEGKINPNVKWSAIVSAAVPAASAAWKGLKSLVTPDAEKLILKALNPPKGQVDQYKKIAHEVLTYIKKTHPEITTLQQLDDVIKAEADNIWSVVDDAYKKAGQVAAVNGTNTVYQHIIDFFKKETKLLREYPNLMDDYIIPFAEKYKGIIPVNEADDILRDTNALMKSFYNKAANAGLGDAFTTTLGTKLQTALAEGLRTGIDDAVEVGGLPAVKEAREFWGKLAKFGQMVHNRLAGVDKNSLTNLQQGLNIPQAISKFVGAFRGGITGGAEAAGQIGMSTILKDLNSADTMIKTAFEKMGSIPGLLGKGGRLLTSLLEGTQSQVSPKIQQEKQQLDFNKIKLPIETMKNNIISAVPKNNPMLASIGKLAGALIPTANAAPKIPTAAPKLPAPAAPAAKPTGILKTIAPNLAQGVQNVNDIINNLGNVTAQQWSERAFVPEPYDEKLKRTLKGDMTDKLPVAPPKPTATLKDVAKGVGITDMAEAIKRMLTKSFSSKK